MLGLPQGELFINEVKKENSVMFTDIDNYEEFKNECDYIFKEYKDAEKVIYKYGDEVYYELTKEELKAERESEESGN